MRRRLGFVDGIGVTLGALALLFLAWMAIRGDGLARMYAELGGELPLLAKVVLHPAWRFGIVAVVLGALVVSALRATHRFAVLAAGIAGIAAAVLSYVGAYSPIWALAGNISG